MEGEYMALSQVLWSLNDNQELTAASLTDEKELEILLEKHIELLNPNWMVIGRQVRTENGKYLDLLCIDRDEDLVVIELKKDLTPREVTAQVIEYASYLSDASPSDLAKIYWDYSSSHLDAAVTLSDAYKKKFNSDLDEEQLNQKVKMVIVAAKMDDGTEHIIQYLRQAYMVDINILFFEIYQHGQDRFLSRVWLEKDLEYEKTAVKTREWNQEYYVSFGSGSRQWEDAVKYGFISAGGGTWYTKTLSMLQKGDRIWVNIPQCGYVGAGIVTGTVMQAGNALLNKDGSDIKFSSLSFQGDYFYSADDPENGEYIVPVQWLITVPQNKAVKETGFFGNQNSVCRPLTEKWQFTVDRLKSIWNI